MLCACIDVDSSSDVAIIASLFPGNTNKAIKQLKTGIKESAEPVRYQLACCLVILALSACRTQELHTQCMPSGQTHYTANPFHSLNLGHKQAQA